MNNFKRMQEEDEALYDEYQERRIKAGVVDTLGFLRFVGQLVDIYLPRAVDLFVITAGGQHPKKHHDPAAVNFNADRRHAAPGPETEESPVD